MSDAAFVICCVGMLLAGGVGFMLGSAGASPVGEFDKICYQHNPNWTYQEDSALYWNNSLNISCEEEVRFENGLGLTEVEWRSRAELQLEEVDIGE